MAVRVERPNGRKGQRAIVISDIHANLKAFLKLLKKVDFSEQDILILLGDMVEKGESSLDMLHYVMELKKTHNVYAVCGNCDAIAMEVLKDNRNEDLLKYILLRKQTLVGEMCRAAGAELNRNTDMGKIKKELQEIYKEELSFISELPHIIEIGRYVFAHAAVYPGRMEEMKPSQAMKADDFMNQGYHFEKYHVVGHWPTSLYCKEIPDCNPRIDRENKIISIDGGNVLKRDGQLNALIIPDLYEDEVSFTYVDQLRKAKVLNTQEAGEKSLSIPWTDSLVELLRTEKDFTYCEHLSTGYKMWIPNSYLCEERDGWHTEDISDYQIPLTYGDIVSVTEETSRGYLVKKNGVVGWYYGMLEFLPEEDEKGDSKRRNLI